jgi:hypothetical protein
MRAELYRPDTPEVVVAVATWKRGEAELEVLDPSVDGLDRLFRATPVVVDDASERRQGTSGEVLLDPGTLEWFRAALLTRGAELGLATRFVPGSVRGGWDPAAQYRTFSEQVERLNSAPNG